METSAYARIQFKSWTFVIKSSMSAVMWRRLKSLGFLEFNSESTSSNLWLKGSHTDRPSQEMLIVVWCEDTVTRSDMKLWVSLHRMGFVGPTYPVFTRCRSMVFLPMVFLPIVFLPIVSEFVSQWSYLLSLNRLKPNPCLPMVFLPMVLSPNRLVTSKILEEHFRPRPTKSGMSRAYFEESSLLAKCLKMATVSTSKHTYHELVTL